MDQRRSSDTRLQHIKSLYLLTILLLANLISYFHFINFRPERPEHLLSVRVFVMTYTVYLTTEGVVAPFLTILLVNNIQAYARAKFSRLIGNSRALCTRKGNRVVPQSML